MIQLDDHRKANLEMIFASATDKDLIHELIRRGRLRQIQARVAFWPEMREMDNGAYMDSITNLAMCNIAKTLDADGCILKNEYPVERPPVEAGDPMSKQTILNADVIVLRARVKSGE